MIIFLIRNSCPIISSCLKLFIYKHYKRLMHSTNHLPHSIYSTPTKSNSPFSQHQQPYIPSYKHVACTPETSSSDTKSSPRTNNKNLFDSPIQFNPYDFKSQRECSAVTDRYIPTRKLLKKQSLFQDEEFVEDAENTGTRGDNPGTNLSDLYRRYVMLESPQKMKDTNHFESFQNTNILKYSNKSSTLSSEAILNKSTKLQFAQQILSNSPKKRKINKLPIKVLDAPALQDDYYLNLIDWSTQNYLAVGLSSSVYLWNASNSKVNKLCDLGIADTVTSVSWSLKGPLFTLGTNSGDVHLWDVVKLKRLRTLGGHTNRVGAIAWNSSILSTGSRDKNILNRDLRCSQAFINKLSGHKQQVCGLKWSFDDQQLSSGGNDNKLLIWNQHSCQPILKFNDHEAAVKAVAWSPHQHGLLVSGGGTADRTIKFRNTLTGSTIKSVDAGSQVCNIMFSKNSNEIVSTHGYSLNEMNIWKYPNMQKVATLTGHTYRVLYLAMSPDGNTVVTGAGDQTLRFWNIFPGRTESYKKTNGSILSTDSIMLR